MNRRKLLYFSLLVAVGVSACLLTRGMDFRFTTSQLQPVPDENELAEGVVDPEPYSEWATNTEKWREMAARLTKEAQKFPGRMGVYIKDLRTGEEFSYHADELFPSASLVKVPIMASVVRKIKEGEVSWDEKLVIDRAAKRGGSGRLRRVRNGTKMTVRDLMFKMITESDNTAAHLLIERVGYGYLQNEFKTLGLERTGISEGGMSLCSLPVRDENYTTPREIAGLVEKIYRGEVVDKKHSEIMLDIMKQTKGVRALPKPCLKATVWPIKPACCGCPVRTRALFIPRRAST